jgi:hypothetical protein
MLCYLLYLRYFWGIAVLYLFSSSERLASLLQSCFHIRTISPDLNVLQSPLFPLPFSYNKARSEIHHNAIPILQRNFKISQNDEIGSWSVGCVDAVKLVRAGGNERIILLTRSGDL